MCKAQVNTTIADYCTVQPDRKQNNKNKPNNKLLGLLI